jgi:predicted nuclease with RNAse H fold
MIAGIDFGSKKAGTTAIAWRGKNGKIAIAQSLKNKDADQFIVDWATKYEPTTIYIDAPLSLPGVYRQPDQYSDYFYRQGDRELRAMSPMFLGGLTARAMQLKARLEAIGIALHEVYPSALVDLLQLPRAIYKKDKADIPKLLPALQAQALNLEPVEPLQNWHQFDALLALTSGFRHQNNGHQLYGDPGEGGIIV